ncbi:hypothetical protein KDL29_09990 [bacterium]|nr:hypothetical protein [bacterium]
MRLLLPAILCLLCLGGCPARNKLPQMEGLVGEDFGIGLRLLMSPSEVDALGDPAGMEIKLISSDQKNEIHGYDLESDKDEVVAIYYEADPGGDPDPLGGKISDVRCFINTGATSGIRLRGEPIATMGADEVQMKLGEPLDRSESGDGQIHLSYLFDPGLEDKDLQLRLVTSHHMDKSCYAVRLALEHR